MNTVHKILDIFETFLEEKGVVIPNEDRDDDPSAAILYGTDYGDLESLLIDLLEYEPVGIQMANMTFEGRLALNVEDINGGFVVDSATLDDFVQQILLRASR